MAEINLGRVAFLDRGVYSPTESYNKWDFVTTVDSCYLYINTEPSIGEPITNTAYWKCIADGKPSTLAAAAAAAVTEQSEAFRDEAEGFKNETSNLKDTVQGLHDAVVSDAEQTALDRIATGQDAASALQSKNYASGYADTAQEQAGIATTKAGESAGLRDECIVLRDELAAKVGATVSQTVGTSTVNVPSENAVNLEISKNVEIFVFDGYIDDGGSINPKSDWEMTGFIPIAEFNAAYLFTHPSVASISFYTDSKFSTLIPATLITGAGDYILYDRSNITIPPTAVYFVISNNKAGVNRYLNLKSIINNDTRILKAENEIQNKHKFMHISFDDVNQMFKDITVNVATYTTVFDNPLLAELKKLHLEYGAVFSLYCFLYNTGGYALWDIEDTTTDFAEEFSANSDWLKFGLHNGAFPSYDYTTGAEAKIEYDVFVSAILAITGSVDCIDRLPRTHGFAANLDSVKAMRDCDNGVLGFLTADTESGSYNLSADQWGYLNKHDRLYDNATYLLFGL